MYKNTLKEGLVSVITPLYNAERFIVETIESVQNQTYKQLEMIIVDDCSTDNGPSLIEEMSKLDPRIKLIRLKSNQGAAVARNTALNYAKGQYVAFIDSDDYWEPEKLRIQLECMKKNKVAFTYTAFSLVSEQGELIKEKTDVPDSLDYHSLLKNTAIACSTVVIDRFIVGEFNMPNVRKGQDTATWLKLMREKNIKAYGINKTLSHYRQVEDSISSNKLGALKRTWNTYRNLEKLPFYKAIYYFTHYTFNAIRRRL